MLSTTQTFSSKLQISALLILAAGWGWAGGNFTSGLQLWNVLLHGIPLLVVLLIGLQLVRVRGISQVGESPARGAERGMTVFMLITLVAISVLVVLGVSNPNPNSPGVHNLWDWFPTILLYLSVLLWFAALGAARRRSPQ